MPDESLFQKIGDSDGVETGVDVNIIARDTGSVVGEQEGAVLPTSSIVTVRLSGAEVSMYFRILEKSLMPLAASVLIGPEENSVGTNAFGA